MICLPELFAEAVVLERVSLFRTTERRVCCGPSVVTTAAVGDKCDDVGEEVGVLPAEGNCSDEVKAPISLSSVVCKTMGPKRGFNKTFGSDVFTGASANAIRRGSSITFRSTSSRAVSAGVLKSLRKDTIHI